MSQAGLSARETNEALQTLAKTTLAPTFGDITETTEGAIAVLRQFKLETSDLEQALGSINAVAGAFAVSAADIIVAVKQAGAVFASSSQGVSEGLMHLMSLLLCLPVLDRLREKVQKLLVLVLKLLLLDCRDLTRLKP